MIWEFAMDRECSHGGFVICGHVREGEMRCSSEVRREDWGSQRAGRRDGFRPAVASVSQSIVTEPKERAECR